MYPLYTDQLYVRNAWYAAAFSGELSQKPLQRIVMDEPIVLFRTVSGSVNALWGLCAHRNFPLAEGRLIGDAIQCPYHGYRYGTDGSCTHIPGQAGLPQSFRQRVYPCREQGGLVWLWMGDPASADPGLMPPLASVGGDQPGWTMVPNEVTSIPARWPLMIDNLMDLSHIGFLHLKTIEAPDAGEAPPRLENHSGFRVTRLLANQDATMPYVRNAFPGREAPVDVEIGTEFLTPGFLVTFLRFYEPGSGDPIGTSYHYQGVTPESRNTTLGFSLLVRDFLPDAPGFDAWLKDAVCKTREEDAAALAKIERFADCYADARKELSGINDASGIRVRRHLSRLLQMESDAPDRRPVRDAKDPGV